jgi:hypothetical protein
MLHTGKGAEVGRVERRWGMRDCPTKRTANQARAAALCSALAHLRLNKIPYLIDPKKTEAAVVRQSDDRTRQRVSKKDFSSDPNQFCPWHFHCSNLVR